MSRPLRRFTLKLALARGISHSEFLKTTSAREVAEYRALNQIDPLFTGDRVDTATAIQANLAFNLGRHPDTEPTTEADWRPDYTAWLTAKTEDDLSDEYDAWAAQVNQRAKH